MKFLTSLGPAQYSSGHKLPTNSPNRIINPGHGAQSGLSSDYPSEKFDSKLSLCGSEMFDDRELLSSQPLPNDYVRIFRRVGILISQQHGRDHNYWLTIFNFLKLYLGV